MIRQPRKSNARWKFFKGHFLKNQATNNFPKKFQLKDRDGNQTSKEVKLTHTHSPKKRKKENIKGREYPNQ